MQYSRFSLAMDFMHSSHNVYIGQSESPNSPQPPSHLVSIHSFSTPMSLFLHLQTGSAVLFF